MKKKSDLIPIIAERLRREGQRKKIMTGRQKFIISDQDGHKAEFLVRARERECLYTKEDVNAILSSFIDTVVEIMYGGEDVDIKGLGTFRVGWRHPTKGYNPQTRQPMEIPGHYVIDFKVGNALKIAARMYTMQCRDAAGNTELNLDDSDMDDEDFSIEDVDLVSDELDESEIDEELDDELTSDDESCSDDE